MSNSIDEHEPAAGIEAADSRPRVRFQVLALDGGGLRGIFAAAALAALEGDFDTRIIDHFDLVTGTSTGGLVALGLAAGLSAQEIVDFYMTDGRLVFPAARLGRLHRLRRPYNPEGLRDALGKVLGNKTLAQSTVRLAIPAFDQTSNDVYLFRTPHLATLRRDHRELMVDVGLATTAAPTFLPAHHLRGLRLIDGGVWANNPTMIGVVEAITGCGAHPGDVHVLNVGTTTEVVHRADRLDNGSPIWWIRAIVDVAFRGQALSATNHAGLLLPRGHVHRLDVSVPKGLHSLDVVDARNLIGNALAASRKMSPTLAYMFEHKAPPYPNHSHQP